MFASKTYRFDKYYNSNKYYNLNKYYNTIRCCLVFGGAIKDS